MKTVLVTGASSGIGKATAKALLTDGHHVYVAARRLEAMRDLESLGAVALAMDITREADVSAVVDRITADRGAVDVLVNNAGYAVYGSVEETDLDDARHEFEVNLFGLARLTQLLIPGMRERKSGTIVNVSSVGGKIYTPLGAWYHASKHALEGWSDCLRLELRPLGIDVIVIEPGFIRTEFGEVMSEPLLRRSGNGPYADLTRRIVDAGRAMEETGEGSPPEVVAATIRDAIRARRPKTRYATGAMAGRLMFLRKWFGDRMFDRGVMRQLGD